jgi:hypothetical protein|tara:strand:+ start:899 stop:1162 length:264 start_codon:yes stop_codon:yes gene_type:complete
MNGQLIMNAIIAEANAKEAKAIANLQNYMDRSAGIGEHPDVVAECSKLIRDIAEAKELRETVHTIVGVSNQANQQANNVASEMPQNK